MKKLLIEENETLTQIVYDAGTPACPPIRTDSPIYKLKFSSQKTAKNAVF